MKTFIGLFLSFALVLCVGVSSREPALADSYQITTCPAFSGMKWVAPTGATSGTRYMVQLNKHEMNCARATSWAKKLLVQSVSGAGMDQELKGGPPGYICKAFADKTGHAWQGRCKKVNGRLYDPSFNWGPYY